MRRLVVIGGDAAGMTAASQARRGAGRDDLEIVVLERGTRTSYAACGLPYLVEGTVTSPDHLVARTPAEFRERGIDARVHHEVTAIDTDRRLVTVHDLDGGHEFDQPYDDLLIATGATALRPPLPGIDAGGVLELRTIDDALALDELITAGARNAVVVGAGYIGIEVAEALLARGLHVAVVELLGHSMAATLDRPMAQLVDAALRDAGVDLHLDTAVTGFATDGGRVTAVETAGGALPADVVVLGMGIRPSSALAVAAGIPVGDRNGIVVDDHQRTPVPGVWAAGDCVESVHRVSGRPGVYALGTHANKQGRVAGINLTGGAAAFGGVLGTAVTKFQATEVGRTGLTLAEAQSLGMDAAEVTTESPSLPHYYPGGTPMHLSIVAEPGTGRLLGAQIVGGPGAAKRIDVLATALWNGMTVEDVGGMDLSYAPPFSPVWDPVLLAAGKAAAKLVPPA